MSLPKILAFAVMTGISFAFAYRTGGDQSQGGIGVSVLNLFFQNVNPEFQMLIVIASAALTVFFIYRLAGFFRQVYEHRLFGIITALFGFSGSMLVVLAPQANSNVIVLGIALWLVGSIVVFYEKRTKKI